MNMRVIILISNDIGSWFLMLVLALCLWKKVINMSITFKDFKSMYGNVINGVGIPGRARKVQSDNIMLNTWWQDIQA